jgi:hypothetical protein
MLVQTAQSGKRATEQNLLRDEQSRHLSNKNKETIYNHQTFKAEW